jgi:DNA transformation protein
MAVSDGYRDYVLEQLGAHLDVRSKRMFGGVGIYAGDRFFALIAEDTLYFKVDDKTRPRYETAGSTPFRPFGEDNAMGYYTVPADVLEDADLLASWAAEALEVARRARAR